MFKLGLILAYLTLWGPEKLQTACAIACIFFFPLWVFYKPNKKEKRESTRRAPDMDYLYSNNPKSRPYL